MTDNTNQTGQYGMSMTTCDYLVAHQLLELQPNRIVDFGAGGGKYGQLIRQTLGREVLVTAVEGAPDTVRWLIQQNLYDQVDGQLIQKWLATNNEQNDVAIFGDVLEHLTPREIHEVIRLCLPVFRAIIIVCPLHDIFQDESYGNPLEVHRTYVTDNFFDCYDISEKHIIQSGAWLMMNVLIVTGQQKADRLVRLVSRLFHYSVLLLQPLGIARPIVGFAKNHFLRYKWLLGRSTHPGRSDRDHHGSSHDH